MQIQIPDGFEDEARDFFGKCHIDPTEEQIKTMASYCLALGFDLIRTSHEIVDSVVNMPIIGKPNGKIPPGCVCPDCNYKIIIGQDLKRRCNCRVW